METVKTQHSKRVSAKRASLVPAGPFCELINRFARNARPEPRLEYTVTTGNPFSLARSRRPVARQIIEICCALFYSILLESVFLAGGRLAKRIALRFHPSDVNHKRSCVCPVVQWSLYYSEIETFMIFRVSVPVRLSR